jgi:hypothetical protein
MEFKKLIELANEAYPDDRIQLVFDKKPAGDSLATFIVRELKSNFDPKASTKDQLTKAAESLRAAQEELKAVEKRLWVRLDSLPSGIKFND